MELTARSFKSEFLRYMDEEDYTVRAEADAILDESFAGRELTELCVRMVQIVEAAYPAIMKARWA